MARLARWGLALGLVASLGSGVGDARADKWVLLGERTVNDRLDHDTIAVTGSRGDFEAIKLVVRRHAVHVLDLKVHYANGTRQDISLRAVIPAGGESRVIDIRGGDRVISRVEFWYEAKSIGHGQRATVRLVGRR